MKRLAFVVSSGNQDLEDVNISEILEELTKRDVEVEIVAFDKEQSEPYWTKFDLIIPTSALDYTHQYQKLLKVVTFSAKDIFLHNTSLSTKIISVYCSTLNSIYSRLTQ